MLFMNITIPPSSLKLSEQAFTVLRERYLAKDPETGEIIETPEDLIWRVALCIAESEKLYGGTDHTVTAIAEDFARLMAENRFWPNTPALANAGKDGAHRQFSACFVVPVPDDMRGIADAIKAAMLIHQTGGGTGFSFSRLRPKGDRVRSSGGVASGPVSFMRIIDAATEQIKQGSYRRGANMGILSCDHPDILDFIRCKAQDGQIRNFNISVAVTDAFMHAVERNTDWPLINPRTGQPVKRVRARQVWDELVQHAWRNGEPGLFFIDRANADNPVPHLGRIEATNPCGEKPLLPWDACTLGHINLEAHLVERNGRMVLDEDQLKETVQVAVRFLDNVIDAADHPLPQINEMTRKMRQIGLGVMGLARVLIAKSVPYDSEEALREVDALMAKIKSWAWEASTALAMVRGVYPVWPGSRHEAEGRKFRNSYVLTIAPTGCVKGETLIASDQGLQRIDRLGDSHGPQWQATQIRVVSDRGLRAATQFFINGRQRCVTIRTRCGYALTGTPDHRVRALDAEGRYVWRRLDEAKGMLVALVMGQHHAAQSVPLTPISKPLHPNASPLMTPTVVTADLALILGWYMGNGYLKQRGGLHISVPNDNPDLEKEMRATIKRTFNLNTTVESRIGCRQINAHSRYLSSWFHANHFAKPSGNYGDGAAGSFIPGQVLQSPPEVLAAFLRGVFDTDGSISFTGQGTSGMVSVVTVSEPFAEQIQQALLSAGVVTRMRKIQALSTQERFGRRALFCVSVLNQYFLRRFADRIGFSCGIKQARLFTACARPLHASGWKGDVVPGRALARMLREHVRQHIGFSHPLYHVLNQAVQVGRTSRWAIEEVRRLTPAIHDEEWPALSPDFFFDEVTAVEETEAMTYDLSVPEGNTYVANGFVSHNTTSMIAHTSSGIEPEFSLVWFKRVLDGKQIPYICEPFERIARKEGWWSEDLLEQIQANHGSCRGLARVPERWQRVFATAHDIAPEWHVRMQAAVQRHVDSAVSKTINLPASAAVEDVARAYRLAWELGCKGITVYRDGSRKDQVLNVGTVSSNGAAAPASTNGRPDNRSDRADQAKPAKPIVLPAVLTAKRVRVDTPDGGIYVHIGYADGRPVEVFATTPEEAKHEEVYEAFARIFSIALQWGVPLDKLLKQLEGANRKYGSVATIPAAILRAFRMVTTPEMSGDLPAIECPKCQGPVAMQEGCWKCTAGCGWSKCD
ncbi:MAG: hypothetical protein KatS3mg082_2617 [Nitrospiraceae bacterium]|nr:MAG: hypothetical protein KatS3mg082_2617 [Nitrospiraceae bacterium]